ncbi:MAG: M24 family metallopeptidase [Gaiellaceae bacterium]
MPDVLIYGDTARNLELRHEVPLTLGDPFLYMEKDGRKHVMITDFEWPRIQEAGVDTELISPYSLGLDELVDSGLRYWELALELALRAVKQVGVTSALVPPSFPLAQAEHLRANGIELTVERDLFVDRRRVKNEIELAGIRRAQRAAEAGMDAARDLFRRAEKSNGSLSVDGAPLTSERVKTAIQEAFMTHGCSGHEFIVSHGAQSAIGHDMGSGEIRPNEPIVIDLWPKDGATACFADMTRTYCIGEVPDELLDYHRVAKDSLDRSLAAIKEGVAGNEIFAISCEPFHDAGYKTLLNKAPGEVVETGYFHSLGHGVGLEVHEQPNLSKLGTDLRAGDVVTIEPGMYRRGWGGCRLEDLVLVTESGAENLTQYPYELAP